MQFEELYTFYWPKIFRLCIGYVSDESIAKDLAQDTFVKVWQQLPKFRQDSSIGTWIYRIATNNCLRLIEKEKKIIRTDFPIDYQEEMPENKERQVEMLYKFIGELKELDRIIISLELEDVKQADISTIVGISEANVRVRVHRIKEKLTQKMTRHDGEY